ncbi:hypothetical protein QYE76_016625 [Lolium multiflorum]|uniref:Uncharacterized protein n=1 Tax=Lolium multiflorum TaxID=4521 RepID=A0AAD8PUH2_LOLMU|nr:hypothetical protein QYE76_016625 [Lolium multiflorum]
MEYVHASVRSGSDLSVASRLLQRRPLRPPGCVTPNLSPHYQDALPHGGFNPNNLYSPAYEQREPGPGADGDPFTAGSARIRRPVLRRTRLRWRTTRKRTGSGDEEDDDEDEEGGEEEDDEGAVTMIS